MKKALVYSILLHLTFLIIIMLSQGHFKHEPQTTKPVSVVLLPKKIEPSYKSMPKIERMPPIKDKTPPKYLSAIPKGSEDSEKIQQTKNPSEALKTDKNFIFNKKQNPDIFDKDIIAKLSQSSKRNEQFETKQGLSFSAKEFSNWGYLERLREKIERIWQYPSQAAERGIYGDLYIRFTIDKKGNLVSAELIRTSGYRILDEAAMKALKDAQPFWPLPDDWEKDSLTITGHFIYILRSFYLR
ncbi:MAG: energy transducer TonB [Thermodesulfovibrio sp.]|nr:energy transducer TonB [Thermodesulfovibrio sp.]